MSLIWLEPFIGLENNESHSFLVFDNLNVMIVINAISIGAFIFFFILYKLDKNIRRPPSKKFLIRPTGYAKADE